MDRTVSITDAELKIITLLWENAPMTMPQITGALSEETGWTRHTVITLLKRLLAKGAIRMQEASPARLYYPIVQKGEIARVQTRSLLSRMFEGKATLLVSSLVQQGDLTDQDVEELIQLLEKAKKSEE